MELKEVYRGGTHRVVCDGQKHWGENLHNMLRWYEGKCWCKHIEDLRTYFTPSSDLLSKEDMVVRRKEKERIDDLSVIPDYLMR